MKIADKKPNVTFKDLKPGEAFYYCDVLFMKMIGDLVYDQYNAVSLKDGVCTYLGKDTEVRIANVYIEYEGK